MVGEEFSTWEDAVSWLIAQPDKQDLVRACYYDRPVLQAASRFSEGEEWVATSKLFPPTKGRALDVGAGCGIASFALARAGWRTTALEPDASDLVGAGAIRTLARDAGFAIDVVQAFGETLPFTDEEFDLVYGRQVLHHARDLGKFCLELHRVLKPGGVLVTTRDHVITASHHLDKFLERHPLQSLYGGENAFMLREYLAALKAAGFRIDLVLGPLESSINYAPLTRTELIEKIKAVSGRVPLGSYFAGVVLSSRFSGAALSMLSKMDQRPGRLFSFKATKL